MHITSVLLIFANPHESEIYTMLTLLHRIANFTVIHEI